MSSNINQIRYLDKKMVYNEYTNVLTDTIFAEIISSSIYLIKYNCDIGPSVTFIELYSEVPADMKWCIYWNQIRYHHFWKHVQRGSNKYMILLDMTIR